MTLKAVLNLILLNSVPKPAPLNRLRNTDLNLISFSNAILTGWPKINGKLITFRKNGEQEPIVLKEKLPCHRAFKE